MRLIKSSDNQLVVSAPQWLAQIVGLIFLISGCLATLYFYFPFKIECAQKQPGYARQCKVYNLVTHFFGLERYYQKIEKAKILKNSDGRYSLRLYTDAGKQFLAKWYNSDRKVVKNAESKINHYIKFSSSHWVVVPNFISRADFLLFLFIILFSLLFLYIASVNQLTLNQTFQSAVWQKRYLGIFPIGKKDVYSFNEILQFEVQSSYSSRHGKAYQLVCQLKNGKAFAINSVVDANKTKKEEIAEELNKFIKQKT